MKKKYNYKKKDNGKNKTGRPEKFKNPRQLQKQGEKFFAYCEKNCKPLTITGLCLWLNTTRETLMNYQNQEEFSDAIKKLKLRVENYAEENLFSSGGRSVVGAIFSLKNFGWSDKMEINQVSRPYITSPEERERIRANFRKVTKKYAEEEKIKEEENRRKIKEKFGDIRFGNNGNS